MRLYKVTTSEGVKTYHGFGPIIYNAEPEILAIVFNDGTYDCWAIDFVATATGEHAPWPKALEELNRMYQEIHWTGNKMKIVTYRK